MNDRHAPRLTGMREMPEQERPRERLLRLGAEALRDAELIAILFRTGTREHGALALAEQMIVHFGSLRAIAQATPQELTAVKGLGMAKATELKAALELGRRLAEFIERDRPQIRNVKDVVQLMMVRFKDLQDERFRCLLLNTKNEVLRIVEVSKGGDDIVAAMPREVFRQAVKDGATAVILCHNHPSGDPEPSPQDIGITEKLQHAAETLGIRLHDHVIFGDGRYVSFNDRGLM